MYANDFCFVVASMYLIVSGMSWNASSSMEKSQKAVLTGDVWTDFLLYLLPRLLPSYSISI